MNARDLFEHLRDEHDRDLGYPMRFDFMEVLHWTLHRHSNRVARDELMAMREELKGKETT